jgi:uncharacterized protein YhaN
MSETPQLRSRSKFWRGVFCLYAVASVLFFVAQLQSCSGGGAQAAITAADIVNEVAKRGDQAYQVSIGTCHAAEAAAAELPDVTQAEAAVLKIRKACDHAFATLEQVRLALQRVDQAFLLAEQGKLPVRDLVSAALSARELFERARVEHELLAAELQKRP